MRVGIASDHGGFVLKEQIAQLLRDAVYEVVDFGGSKRIQETIIPTT